MSLAGPKGFPERLRIARMTGRKWTQHQLADAMGVSVQAVSQWETGANMPGTERLLRLAFVVGVEVEWLFGMNEHGEYVDPGPLMGGPPSVPRNYSAEAPVMAPLLTHLRRIDFSTTGDDVDPEKEPHLLLKPFFPPAGHVFAVKVFDEAMLPEYLIGDIVIVDTGLKPSPGDAVIASLGGQAQIPFLRKYQPLDDPTEVALLPVDTAWPNVTVKIQPLPQVPRGYGTATILGPVVERRSFRLSHGV